MEDETCGLAALEDKPPDFEEVLEVDEREAGPDAMGAEGF